MQFQIHHLGTMNFIDVPNSYTNASTLQLLCFSNLLLTTEAQMGEFGAYFSASLLRLCVWLLVMSDIKMIML